MFFSNMDLILLILLILVLLILKLQEYLSIWVKLQNGSFRLQIFISGI